MLAGAHAEGKPFFLWWNSTRMHIWTHLKPESQGVTGVGIYPDGREYAYGPANGLPDTKVGTFTQALMDEAKQRGWIVISMKNDWKVIFSQV